jgi:predicted site-specific integrase-resolvase
VVDRVVTEVESALNDQRRGFLRGLTKVRTDHSGHGKT